MRCIVLMLVLCNSINLARGQGQEVIDSLMRSIKHDKSRSDLEIFHELSFQCLGKDNALALKYVDIAISLSEYLGDSLKIVQTRRLKGQILRRSGRQSESFYPFSEALPIAIRNQYQREKGYIYRETGSTLLFLGKFDSAIHSYMKSLQIWEAEGNQDEVSNDLNNIGLAHYRIGNFKKSIEYSIRALALKRANNVDHTATTQINIGLAHVALQHFEEGLRWVDEGLASCSPNCSDHTKMEAAFAQGSVWFGLKDMNHAKQDFQKCYNFSEQLSDNRFKAESSLGLGRVFLFERKYDSARAILQRTEDISKTYSYRQALMDAYYYTSNLYTELGDKTNTLKYIEKYSKLRDSLFSDEVRSKVLAAELEYEQQRDLMALKHQQELLQKKKIEVALVALLCLLLAGLAIALFVLLRNKAKLNVRLDERVRERTRDLESHKLALEKALAEQDIAVDKAMRSVKSVLATHHAIQKAIEAKDLNEERDLEAIANKLNTSLEDLSKAKHGRGHSIS